MRGRLLTTAAILMMGLALATATPAQTLPAARLPFTAQTGVQQFTLDLPMSRRAHPLDTFTQQVRPATPVPAPQAAAPQAPTAPAESSRIPSLVPYDTGLARVPATLCAARIIPMQKEVDPGFVRAPVKLPSAIPPTRFTIRGAEGTCAPNPGAVMTLPGTDTLNAPSVGANAPSVAPNAPNAPDAPPVTPK